MAAVKTEEDLGTKIKNGEDHIEIECELAKKIIRIKATGAVAWAVAIGAIGVAVAAALSTPATGPAGPAVVSLVAAPTVVALGGASVTATAVGIAVAAGGVGALNSLYHDYEIERFDDGHIVLHKK